MDCRLTGARVVACQFCAGAPIQQLRDLTRYRAQLEDECNRVSNRIQKVLEDANIKLASVASDTLGKSGREILDALVREETQAARLADLAKGRL